MKTKSESQMIARLDYNAVRAKIDWFYDTIEKYNIKQSKEFIINGDDYTCLGLNYKSFEINCWTGKFETCPTIASDMYSYDLQLILENKAK